MSILIVREIEVTNYIVLREEKQEESN